jgi:hypothetical protein
MEEGQRFVHRHNASGEIDSICRGCYRTVATEEDERDLGISEKEHVCDQLRRKAALEQIGRA